MKSFIWPSDGAVGKLLGCLFFLPVFVDFNDEFVADWKRANKEERKEIL